MFFLCFFLILLCAAVQDVKTKLILPRYQILTGACFWLNPLWNKTDAFIGFFVCGGILLVACCFSEKGFGGGDIKLSAAAGFALGGIAAIYGLMLSLLFALPQSYFAHKKKRTIAFGPYFAAGYSLAAILFCQGGLF